MLDTYNKLKKKIINIYSSNANDVFYKPIAT